MVVIDSPNERQPVGRDKHRRDRQIGSRRGLLKTDQISSKVGKSKRVSNTRPTNTSRMSQPND